MKVFVNLNFSIWSFSFEAKAKSLEILIFFLFLLPKLAQNLNVYTDHKSQPAVMALSLSVVVARLLRQMLVFAISSTQQQND